MHSSVPPQCRRSSFTGVALLLFAVGLALPQTAPVPARTVPLLRPSAIAYDRAGNLYIAETQRHLIRKVDNLGNITNFAGDGTQGFSGDGGPAVAAHLNSPQGVVLDASGNLFLSDSANHRVRRVDAITNVISTVAGDGKAAFAGDGGPALAASLSLPRSLCLDPSGKNLYIADTRNHRIRRVDLTTARIETIAGNGVEDFAGDGALATSASLDSPDGIAVDLGGNLFIADTHNGRIRQVSAGPRIIQTIIGPGSVNGAAASDPAAPFALARPRGISSDAGGNLYLADPGNHHLLRIDGASGAVSVLAGGATQGFAGDGGLATSAALDSPAGVAISPQGLISISDTATQRVRQLSADPAPSTTIQTIAGLGNSVPGIFTLSAPTVTPYGGGSLLASLSASEPASGQVTFFDLAGGSNAIIGASLLRENAASISLSALPVGQHRFMATYAGDTSHPAAQTPAALLTIAPLPLRVTPAPATMVYGSPLPALSGLGEGLLPQDHTRVTISFATIAVSLSPVGSYPISATLTGEAAGNYTLQQALSDLVITQANSSTLLQNDSSDPAIPGAFRIQVNSASSGTPSGAVTLSDNGVLLQRATLTSTASAAFAATVLPPGAHTLSALYSGDPNFLPSSSTPLSVVISPLPTADFTVSAADPASQILLAGGSISYTFTVQMVRGGPPSPVVLSVSGLPAFTRAAFAPAYIPPGASGPTAVTLTITSFASSASQISGPGWTVPSCFLAFLLPLCGLSVRYRGTGGKRSAPALLTIVASFFVLAALAGCGDRINSAGQSSSSLQSYTLAITGSATDSKGASLAHTANVLLKMNSTH